MSIPSILEKIKAFIKELQFTHILMIFIIILVGLAGFGLGRLSTSGEGKSIIIETSRGQENTPLVANPEPQNLASGEVTNTNTGTITASKNGTKYYFPWCKGVNNIHEENRIYFSSEKEAIDAGYEKAKGC